MSCSACGGAGWVLDCNPQRVPVMAELLPCLLPDCEHSGRPLVMLSFPADLFTIVARHPATGAVMSVSRTA